MPANFLETKSEAGFDELPPEVGVLVFVLRYEDVGAGASMAMPPLINDQHSIEIGRAVEAGPVKREGRALRLPDPFASRVHARLTRKNKVDFIEDLGSKQGTFVNDNRIDRPTALEDGDCIEIGHSLFVYCRVDALTAIRMADTAAPTLLGPTQTLCPDLIRISTDLGRMAQTDQPILLLGETGAGKEIAARFVHDKSQRKGPFVAIDCGAIAPHLVEGELFGHKRGAFSGAHEERAGRIRSADGGTVFLDEIGNMPEQAQATLLRVVQEREVVPVGADKGKQVDVRWVAATNADVFAESSTFRSDLRARLAGYVVRLPPLRKRREDLGFLVAFVLAKHGISSASMTRKAARALFLSDLPGNVRELERSLTSAAILAGNGPVDIAHLSGLSAQSLRETLPAPRESSPPNPEKTKEPAKPEMAKDDESSRERPYTRRPSKEDIELALHRAKRVQSEAARLLGVHERQLARWMDAYGIERAKRGLGRRTP